tara:strand:+ start:846 stop:1730 length:885 start_codon:yes stop_codon:yes gene_type:complete
MSPLRPILSGQNIVDTRLGSAYDLLEFIEKHPELFVITGAGISSNSGIQTYRDEIGNWKSNNPIQHSEFLNKEAARKRYWARSFGGWPNVASAKPNDAHKALVKLESKGYVSTLVTQNVDRLHQKAGHKKVTDLHGRLDQVVCMDCGSITSRDQIQAWLRDHNPHISGIEIKKPALRPDGDADVGDELVHEIKVPQCLGCNGLLKPNVVFYGSTVNKEVVNYLLDRLQKAKALLVIGTSLMVYSSFRFCKYANENQIPMACVNQGLTRGDGLFSLKVGGDSSEILNQLISYLPE